MYKISNTLVMIVYGSTTQIVLSLNLNIQEG